MKDSFYFNSDVITLPFNPNIYDKVFIVDERDMVSIDNITIGRNGKNIMGLAEDMIVDIDYSFIKLIYSGNAIIGWRIMYVIHNK